MVYILSKKWIYSFIPAQISLCVCYCITGCVLSVPTTVALSACFSACIFKLLVLSCRMRNLLGRMLLYCRTRTLSSRNGRALARRESHSTASRLATADGTRRHRGSETTFTRWQPAGVTSSTDMAWARERVRTDPKRCEGRGAHDS